MQVTPFLHAFYAFNVCTLYLIVFYAIQHAVFFVEINIIHFLCKNLEYRSVISLNLIFL